MELRQLSYFILACQHKNHAKAAAQIGISASTLSENISLLENELGLTLFQRGPHGHYPTEVARWLHLRVEPMLQCTEAAGAAIRDGDARPIDRLNISTPLQFMLGRLSRAASLSLRALREDFPQVLARVRWSEYLPQEAGQRAMPDATGSSAEESHVILDYASDVGDDREELLFRDEWISITNVERYGEPEREVEFDVLRRTSLLLPPMSRRQHRIAREYCARHDLPEPVIVDEDVGTFPRLSRDTDPFFMLAPQSLVAGGLARLGLDHARLPVDLASPVVARVVRSHPAARAYVDHLKRIVQDDDVNVIYDPKITTKQIRYFLTLREQLNVTAAARKLNVAQPALSNQLRKLESLFGRHLFRRHSSGLEPMADAHRLAAFFEEIVERWERTVFDAAHISTVQRQRLSIGIIPVVNHTGPLVEAVTGALEEWADTYPRMKLQVLEAPTNVLQRWVQAGTIGFALVEAHVPHASRLDLQSEDALGVVSSPERALLPPGDIALARALELPLVLPGETFGLRQLLMRAADEMGLRLSPTVEVNSLTMVLALVRRMHLATVMPEAAVRPFVDAGTLQFNRLVDPPVRRRLSIIFSTARSLTETERGFIAILRRHLALFREMVDR